MTHVTKRQVISELLLILSLGILLTACGGGSSAPNPTRIAGGGSGPGGTAARGIGSGPVPVPHSLTVQSSPASGGAIVSSPAAINCGSVCTSSFVTGTQVSLTVAPANGFAFTGWSGGCTGTGACTFALDSDTSVTASFSPSAPAQFVLTVNTSGAGTGTVSSMPAGIACATSCSAAFDSGSTVTLTANPQPGSLFAGWTGACSGTATCSVTLNSSQVVGVAFLPSTVPLMVALSGSGSGSVTSSPSGINCGGTCTFSFASGSAVTLTAVPAGGSFFAGWTGACSGTGTCNLTVGSAGARVAAVFSPNLALTVTLSGSGSGAVVSSDGSINCGTTCSAAYTNGTVVTLTPAAAAGSTFAGWSGACSGTGTCNVTINAAQSVGASFIPNDFALDVTLSGSGSGSVTSLPPGISCTPACTANYASGTNVSLSASASSGSIFAGWTGACSGTSNCSVMMGTSPQAVTATFSPQAQYSLTVATSGAGSGAITSTPAGIDCGATCSANFSSGASVTLNAVAAAGSAFAGWSAASCTGVGPCTVSLTSSQTVTAMFVPVFPLTVAVTGGGQGTVTSAPLGVSCPSLCNANFNQGTSVTLTASPSSGFGFNGWSGACSGGGACAVSMNAAQSVSADFEPSKSQAAPFLSISPSPLSFGTVQTGTVSNLTVQLSNTGGSGTGDLTVTAASADNGLFNVPSAQFPIVLSDSAVSKPMTISFGPQATGGVSTTITFTSNAANSPNLQSTGAGSTTGNSGGSLTVGPSTLYFGNVSLGSTATQTVTMSNPGAATTQVSTGTVTGSGFSIVSPSFPLTLAPGATQLVTVSFTPSAAGASTGVVTFTSNAVGGTPVISLVASGNGTSPSTSVTVAPSTFSFGNVLLNTTSLALIGLFNTGNTSVTVNNATILGTGFSFDTSVLPVTIPVGGSQDVTVSFNALGSGPSTGTLTFSSNAPGASQTVSLSANGVSASAHTVTLTWNASISTVAGYNVYRSTSSGLGFQKINGTAIGTTSFTDTSVASGQTYYYVVRSVTSSGLESTNSNEVFAIIPNP